MEVGFYVSLILSSIHIRIHQANMKFCVLLNILQ